MLKKYKPISKNSICFVNLMKKYKKKNNLVLEKMKLTNIKILEVAELLVNRGNKC